ncbi:glutamyl-tRNA amidotransferase, subunit A, c-terminal region [Ectocarpus siliculosus]|uniref:Glutamyl-tRNA amidotransferase, subunit A, c-terminal region n=1 Tax=Ectocarpus siliculosus TaxID=2880 RepID=D8LTD4_ECTSI|nr:glutamyl-tRNA amidotransferase, subunit A, c-terminal region [Ectocarpus siliculosus]|eukprot:CBN78044.1 glutamyl-tRNA amidotransferase, subunit A, c-terminal region [Ectocarpus siliculosus]
MIRFLSASWNCPGRAWEYEDGCMAIFLVCYRNISVRPVDSFSAAELGLLFLVQQDARACSLPHWKRHFPRCRQRNSEATSSKEAMLKSRHDGFGAEVRQRIILGTFSLSSGYSDKYYKRAQAIREGLSRDFSTVFEKLDVLVCPTAPTTAYRLGEYAEKGVGVYADDVFTTPASLAGLPGLSVPCGQDRAGLPIGVQLMGQSLSEDLLLRVGQAYESATPWHRQFAPGVSASSPAAAVPAGAA